METTKTNNEALNEGVKVLEQLFNNTNAFLMETYNKQLDLTTSLYSNFLSSTLGNRNGWNRGGGFPNMFSNFDMTKWFSNPFANFSGTAFSNPFLAPFDLVMKQVLEFDQNLLSAFTNGVRGKDINWNPLSEEYKDALATRLETSKKIFNIISEATGKQLESSMETNKKMMEEISLLSNSVLAQNQKFWDGVLKTYQVPFDGAEKRNREQHLHESKKRSHIHEVA